MESLAVGVGYVVISSASLGAVSWLLFVVAWKIVRRMFVSWTHLVGYVYWQRRYRKQANLVEILREVVAAFEELDKNPGLAWTRVDTALTVATDLLATLDSANRKAGEQ